MISGSLATMSDLFALAGVLLPEILDSLILGSS